MDPGGRTTVLTREFAWVAAATTAVFTSFGVLVLALPLYIRDELAESDFAVGAAIGVASLSAIVVGPIAGRIADRRGRRIIAVVSAVAMAAGYVVLAFEPSLGVILPLRLVVGAAESACAVACYTMATDVAPGIRTGEAVSLVTAGSYCGLAAGPLLGDLLVDRAGYPAAWIFAAALVSVTGAIVYRLRETRPEFEEEDETARTLLPPRSALLPGAILLLALIGFGGFNAFAALHAREVGLERPGVVFAVFASVVIAVRVLARAVPDRLGGSRGAALACGTIALGLLVIAAFPSPVGLLVGAAVFAAGQAFGYPAVVLLATARARVQERSAVLGALIAFIDVALASGAFVLGIAAELSGYRAVFAAGALSAVAGLVLLWWMSSTERGFTGRERSSEAA